jgi:hypothetical protein
MDQLVEHLRIQCESCGKKIKVPPTAAGKKVRCPGCQGVIGIPAAEEPPEAVEADDPFAGLGGGETIETERPVLAQPKPKPKSAASRRAVASEDDEGRPSSLDNPFVRMAIGTGACAVACVISAVAWYFIEVTAGVRIGYVALGVGALAGVAMYVGLGRLSEGGGMLAGLMAASAIIIANHVCYFAVMGQLMEVVTPNPNDNARDRLAYYIAMETSDTPEITSRMSVKRFAELLEVSIQDELSSAKSLVAMMEPSTIKSELEEYDHLNAKMRAEVLSAKASWQSFGFLDIVFCLLAIGAAYRLGSRGLGSGGE